MMKRITNPLILRVLPIVCVIMAIKFGAHQLGWEILTLNPLFSGIIAANVFLLGFLISGVLSDYKESEKIPGELAASIETIVDEASIIYKSKRADSAKECLDYMRDFTVAVKSWLFQTTRTKHILGMVHGLNDY